MRRRILLSKVWRDVVTMRAQFFTLFLMILMAGLVYVGVFAYVEGMTVAGEEYFTEYNLPDMVVETGGVGQKEFEKVQKINEISAVERVAVFDGVTTSADGVEVTLRMHVIEQNELSRFFVVEGEGFSERDGVWLDSKLAKKRGWKVGDEIRVGNGALEIDKKILGLVMSPDKVYDLESEDQVFAAHESYGFLYVGANYFGAKNKIQFSRMMIGLKDKNDFEKVKSQVLEVFPKAVVLARSETMSQRTYEAEKTEGLIYIVSFSGIFLAVAILVAVSTMSRMIKKQRREIGIMRAMGMKNGKIMRLYASYGTFLAVVAVGVASVVAPMTISRYFLKMLSSTYAIPNLRPAIPMVVWMVSAGVVGLMTVVTGLTCKNELKGAVAETLGGGKQKKAYKLAGEAGRKWPLALKWNLRDMIQNKMRTMVGVAGIGGAVMVVICGLGMVDTMEGYLRWQFEDLTKYQYRVKIDGRAEERTVKDLMDKYGKRSTMNFMVEMVAKDEGEGKNKKVELLVDDAVGMIAYNDENRRELKQMRGDGVYVTWKLKEEFGLEVGARVLWRALGTEKWQESEIVGVIRKPHNQNLTMKREYFESLGEKYRPSLIYCGEGCMGEDLGDDKMRAGVESIKEVAVERADFEKMMRIVKAMARMMMAASMIMSAVIIYNLGAISLAEKAAEYGSLVILGFRKRKVARIFKLQNYIVTLLAMMVGVPLGGLMLKVIFQIAIGKEWDFIPEVSFSSYMIVAGLVLFTTLVTNGLLTRKILAKDFGKESLRKVD